MLGIEHYLSREKAVAEATLAKSKNGAPQQLALAQYAGRYRDGGSFGVVEIKVEARGLVLHVGIVDFDLQHWSGNRFAAARRAPYPMARAFFLDFQIDALGGVSGIRTSYGDDFVATKGRDT